MANFNPTIITDSGLSLIAKISSGSGQMSFTRICTSKSSYSVDEAQHLSALTTVEQEATIDKVEIINDTAVKVSAVITNKLLESGYYINAIGLYAEDPDLGEILYSITIAKVPDWMQPDSGSGVSSLLIQLITQVSNSSTVKTELNPSVLATVQDLSDHADNADIHVTSTEKASWNGKAELSDIPTSLPANGGNADTLDGKHADDFCKIYNHIDDSYDVNNATEPGLYRVKGGINTPTTNWYDIHVTNLGGYTTQIAISDINSMFKRCKDSNGWSEWFEFAVKNDIPTTLPANGGTANTARETISPNAKALLWEDNEGGNLKLVSPDGNHSVEMDLYNNAGFRMYFTDNGELTFPADYNSTTKKFNINGNAETVGGFNNRTIFRPYYLASNANDCYTNGSYMCTPDTTNIPSANYGILVSFNGEGDKINNTWVCQNFYPTGSNYVYHRFWTNNTWTNWERMASVNDIPTSLPANGGNAATVNGLTVQTAVPANAKFTDTTYGNASASAPGLVSTGAQTFAGNKTFNGQVIPAGATAYGTPQARKLSSGTAEKNTTNCPSGAWYGKHS